MLSAGHLCQKYLIQKGNPMSVCKEYEEELLFLRHWLLFSLSGKNLEAVMKKIEEETGAELTLEPGRMIPPFINNAAFDLDESVLTDALEFLFHMVTEP